MTRVALLAALVALALPSSAAAHSIIRINGATISYTSSDATSLNNLVVTVSGTDLRFRDETVDGGIDYGTCRPGEANARGEIIEAFCTRSGLTLARIDLGEREDTLDLRVDINSQAIGGPGADRLTTAGGADTVVGGEGNDTIAAGAGNDNILAGEGDDTVTAGDGNDQLQAGGGLDRLDAGAGDDEIRMRDGAKDSLACGDSGDKVDADSLDDVAGDCESVTRAATAPADEPAQPGQPAQPRPAVAAAEDREAPRVRAGALVVQRLRGRGVIRVHATSTETGAIAASGYLSIAGVRYALNTVRKDVAVDGGGVTLELKPSRGALRKARSALRRRKRVRVILGVVATDRAGNSRQARAPVIRLTR